MRLCVCVKSLQVITSRLGNVTDSSLLRVCCTFQPFIRVLLFFFLFEDYKNVLYGYPNSSVILKDVIKIIILKYNIIIVIQILNLEEK